MQDSLPQAGGIHDAYQQETTRQAFNIRGGVEDGSRPGKAAPVPTGDMQHHLNTPLSFSMALWNFQSAVNKADFISAFSLQSTLSILGLTETWICPEDSATPAALSNNFSFSYTPRQVGRGGGTGLLI